MTDTKKCWRETGEKVWSYVHTNITFLNFLAMLLILLLMYGGIFHHDIIKVVIWPTLVTLFVVTFTEDLSGLISRIRKVILPGGTEINTDQQEKNYQSSDPKDVAKDIIENYKSIADKLRQQVSEYQISSAELVNRVGSQEMVIHFERIYNVISKDQINFLKFIHAIQAVKKSDVSADSVQRYFQELQTDSPLERYLGWNFEPHIGFLKNRHLIQENKTKNPTF